MDAVKSILFNTLYQLWWFVGVVVAAGTILYLLARTARRNYSQSFGANLDTYLTGWIGTPVHEFGHWLFCIVFRHKVKEVRFFKPDPKSGTLGYVAHSYNKKSIYQNVGNFFIGVAPMLVGAAIIMGLAYLLLPSHARMVALFNDFTESWAIEVSYGWKSALVAVADSFWLLVKLLASKSNFHAPLFWLFIYLSFCISSHMMLSMSDLKAALWGGITILGVLLLVNITSELVELFAKDTFKATISNKVSLLSLRYGAASIFLLTYAIALSFFNMVISLIVNNIGGMFKK